MNIPVYLDCNATTPIDPRVRDEVLRFLSEEFGNEGSRTHDYGARARQAVQQARDQVAEVVGAKRDEVIFTSGATESNNLALLGLARHGKETGSTHIISTQIEHKAILEPLDYLATCGFDITLVPPRTDGWVDPDGIKAALRRDTLLISVMHVNNETGILQPITQIAEVIADHPAYLHVDAAQGFGKDLATLKNPRIDLISISGHKIFGPKGIGALVTRRRGFKRPPLTPVLFGGGQERGLRPGTLPVPLIVGLGLASELALREMAERALACRKYRDTLLRELITLEPVFNGDPEQMLPQVVNLSFPGLDSEAMMLALKDIIAISNGSACTSRSYQPSHVLKAMGVPDQIIQGAVRISWCHMTQGPDWSAVAARIRKLL
jgi:cysteine desulfurase